MLEKILQPRCGKKSSPHFLVYLVLGLHSVFILRIFEYILHEVKDDINLLTSAKKKLNKKLADTKLSNSKLPDSLQQV